MESITETIGYTKETMGYCTLGATHLINIAGLGSVRQSYTILNTEVHSTKWGGAGRTNNTPHLSYYE